LPRQKRLKLKKPTWSPKSYEVEERNLKHLKPAFGSLLLIDVTAEDISDYQESRLKSGAASKTINLELGTLRAVLRRHRVWANLQPDVKLMPVREKVGKALPADEEKKLREACGMRRSRALLPIVTLALHTGMRRGEIQSLQWERVDFLNRTLTVGATKTEAGSGLVIPLNERALLTLQTWATNFPVESRNTTCFLPSTTGSPAMSERSTRRRWTPTRPLVSSKARGSQLKRKPMSSVGSMT
jgi:integrase